MERPPAADDRPEILALRAIKLGDLLVAVPALTAVRKAHPEHRIILAATAWLEPLVDLIDSVDAFLPQHGVDHPIALAPGRVETVVNLHGQGPKSTALLDALAPRRRIGHRFGELWQGPEWQDGVHERSRWADLVSWHGMPADPDNVAIADPGDPPFAGASVIHVGAAYGSRLWPADRFSAVARELTNEGRHVVLTGGAGERERALDVAAGAGLPEERVLAGHLDLRAFAALIASAAEVVTVDTGAAHLASAYRVPSVVIFGPAPVEAWGPPPGPHIALTEPGLRRGDAFADEPDPALLAVTVDDVMEALERVRR